MKKFSHLPKNNSGFMTAEFLFAFTMVIGAGILIFAFTFALTTVEIAQYIVWSSARAYAVGSKQPDDSKKYGETKYENLTAAFPLLTGNGADSPWFKMAKEDLVIGDLANAIKQKDPGIDAENKDPGGEPRHPWLGVQSSIDLILFKGLQIPFLGKITATPEDFKFPLRAVLFRHPSYTECHDFFLKRYAEGIKELPSEPTWKDPDHGDASQYTVTEDNGC